MNKRTEVQISRWFFLVLSRERDTKSKMIGWTTDLNLRFVIWKLQMDVMMQEEKFMQTLILFIYVFISSYGYEKKKKKGTTLNYIHPMNNGYDHFI